VPVLCRGRDLVDAARLGGPLQLAVALTLAAASGQAGSPPSVFKLGFADFRPQAGLGVAVAATEDVVLAGARRDQSAQVEAGAAVLFRRLGESWSPPEVLLASDAAAWAHLGFAVALGPDGTAAIGAFKDSEGGLDAGAVYVLHVDATGSEVQKLLAPVPTPGERFGQSLAVDSDRLVVGAPGGGGRALVFERPDGVTWRSTATLQAADPTADANFGAAVAVAGDVIVVGAPLAGGGAVYVFGRDAEDQWTQQARLVDEAPDARFGADVAVLGDRLAVGAPTYASGTWQTGAVAIYSYVATEGWTRTALLLPTAGERATLFGLAVDLQDDWLAVGAPADDQAAPNGGAVHLFRHHPDGSWPLVTKLGAADAEEGDAFGRAVALAPNLLAVGSVFDDPAGRSSGSVYVFTLPIERTVSTWQPSDPETLDLFPPPGARGTFEASAGARLGSTNDPPVCPVDAQPMAEVGPEFFNICGKEIAASFPGLPNLLDQLAATLASGIGSKIQWEYLERLPGQPDWSGPDALFSGFAAAGLDPLVTLRGTPAWASSQPSAEQYWLYPPADLEDWAAFVSMTVARYGSAGQGSVHRWEIWNEPNLSTFFLGQAEDYVALLNTAYQAVKQADEHALVYAPAVVFHPWNAGSAEAFLDTVIDAGSFDVLSIHLYFAEAGGFYDTVTMARQKLDAAGLPHIPLAVTEVNAISSIVDCRTFSELDEWWHAELLRTTLACLANAGAGSVFWFKSTDRGLSCGLPDDDVDLLDGLLDAQWQSKANADAFRQLVRSQGGIFADGFETGDSSLWSTTSP